MTPRQGRGLVSTGCSLESERFPWRHATLLDQTVEQARFALVAPKTDATLLSAIAAARTGYSTMRTHQSTFALFPVGVGNIALLDSSDEKTTRVGVAVLNPTAESFHTGRVFGAVGCGGCEPGRHAFCVNSVRGGEQELVVGSFLHEGVRDELGDAIHTAVLSLLPGPQAPVMAADAEAELVGVYVGFRDPGTTAPARHLLWRLSRLGGGVIAYSADLTEVRAALRGEITFDPTAAWMAINGSGNNPIVMAAESLARRWTAALEANNLKYSPYEMQL